MRLRGTDHGLTDLSAGQRRAVHGWCMYDWANSGFATSGVAVLPVYFVALFRDAFGPETQLLGFTFTGSSMWSLGIAISTALVALSSPMLGVVADRSRLKKKLLFVYTLAGSMFAVLSFFAAYTGAAWLWIWGCFVIANVGFAGGTVFYNSFLPHLGPKERLDDISSRGFAYGYVGGGLLLTVHLVFILIFAESDHLELVTRIIIASAGIWWFGWALWTFKTLPEPDLAGPPQTMTPLAAAGIAFAGMRRTLREIARFRSLLLYLLAFLLFNDGIQTVLSVAGAYAADTLGIPLIFSVVAVLLLQFIAAVGAVMYKRLAARTSTKRALSTALMGWCVVIALAVGLAPLQPEDHEDFEFQLESTAVGGYLVTESPELADVGRDQRWEMEQGSLSKGVTVSSRQAGELAEDVAASEHSRFTISIRGGPLDGTRRTGHHHPSNLEDGPIDWLPRTIRALVWGPLGLSVNFQWLLLGALLGLVLGGSQPLARSVFAYMTPESRSAEFFGFLGFVGRASAVIGPTIYLVFTAIYDTRVAVLLLLVVILAGTAMLRWVDVEGGRAAAEDVDRLAARGEA